MNIWPHIGISAGGVVGVVVATVVLYAVFVAILHFWGIRYLAAGSTMSVAVFTVLGALCARAMLGNSPTLCGALVAMATLFVLEFGFGRLHAVMSMRSHRAAGRARAWAVMIDGRARPDALRHVGLTAERLHERLRAGGVRHLDDVALAVLDRAPSRTASSASARSRTAPGSGSRRRGLRRGGLPVAGEPRGGDPRHRGCSRWHAPRGLHRCW